MTRPKESHDVAFLPPELFWMILRYLQPNELVRCRRVSRAWNEAFTNPNILLPLLKRCYPWTKEAKSLRSEISNEEKEDEGCRLFDQVASRYYHLGQGKPRSIEKYRLCDDFGSTGDREWYQVQPWESHASHKKRFVDRQFSEALWTFEDGLLVYPSADYQFLVLMDLETDGQFTVPFIIRGKVVRRVRLQKRLLVVEWAEPKAFHWLNDSDGVHRHFASSFDVTKGENQRWNIVPRNEWKIMFLGHPLSERDRFFSSHSNTHYVIYIWQPNRSLYTADEDAPIESLSVWDISTPSSYRPSLDPTGRLRDYSPSDSPSMVAQFGFRDLEFFGIRQRGCPSIQRLEITDDAQAVEITENFCIRLEDQPPEPYGFPQPITTSIPLGDGPHQRRDFAGILPPYRGNCSMQAEAMRYDGFIMDPWYGVIAQVSILEPDVGFCLHFDPWTWIQDQLVYLTIQTPHSSTTCVNWDFIGRGRLVGCENYLVGENCNRELVIYRFDR
ncbi:uncharacterized protein N7479_004727 [Penicillium vulpinum]|uniref:F-box domain-containing protein n=1 Tax=Penicillium vulpinum TaxID=29845 RepID=A0A1V6RT45_9EURO|nr:uncharacterized protein N7479_004727 [Penicillium vulpinum]KAJ5964851.1 hypothetical protein N7479_004727 [Penicillium vulpinum]OQE04649.1 hypothetical protein PENVUL_c031G04837 [Penicillium vulpinum]